MEGSRPKPPAGSSPAGGIAIRNGYQDALRRTPRPRHNVAMTPYLVRLIGTRDLVGFYTARSIGQLQDLVDECVNIDQCEYIKLPPGGIQWESTAVEVPLLMPANDIGDENSYPSAPWAEATATSSWDEVLRSQSDGWRPLFPIRETFPPIHHSADND